MRKTIDKEEQEHHHTLYDNFLTGIKSIRIFNSGSMETKHTACSHDRNIEHYWFKVGSYLNNAAATLIDLDLKCSELSKKQEEVLKRIEALYKLYEQQLEIKRQLMEFDENDIISSERTIDGNREIATTKNNVGEILAKNDHNTKRFTITRRERREKRN